MKATELKVNETYQLKNGYYFKVVKISEKRIWLVGGRDGINFQKAPDCLSYKTVDKIFN